MSDRAKLLDSVEVMMPDTSGDVVERVVGDHVELKRRLPTLVYTRRSAAEQGLPPTVEDPAVLRRISQLIHD